MSELQDFARLVSLACHDLRTPLATMNGFARTLPRLADVGEPASRYLELMSTAGDQLSELLDDLGTAARIEAGRWEPTPVEADSLALAHGAAGALDDAELTVAGIGARVHVDAAAAQRSLVALARCVARHGGLERLSLAVDGAELALSPVAAEVAPIVLAEDLRDLGAAVAGLVLPAAGASLALEGERLMVRLPAL